MSEMGAMSSRSYQPKQGDTPNDTPFVNVTTADLPLHCPLDRMRLWDSHPKVYLPLDEDGMAKCPYCGTRFILNDPQSAD